MIYTVDLTISNLLPFDVIKYAHVQHLRTKLPQDLLFLQNTFSCVQHEMDFYETLTLISD